MSDFVGVIHELDLANSLSEIPISLKREAVLFDRIAIPMWCHFIDGVRESKTVDVNELRWLLDRGIIFAPEPIIEGAGITTKLAEHKEYKTYEAKQQELQKEMDKLKRRVEISRELWMCAGDGSNPELDRRLYEEEYAEINREGIPVWNLKRDYEKRQLAVALRECRYNAVPILTSLAPALDSQAEKSDVIQIVISQLPIPDESTPWEQILEFRSDPDSYSKFLALRNWMNEVSRNKLTAIEVEQKLEHLMDLYQQHMKLHKMKTNRGALETVLVSGAEIAEDLVRFKFSKAVKAFFAVKHRKIALLEGELKAPGSEVAYIVKAKEAF